MKDENSALPVRNRQGAVFGFTVLDRVYLGFRGYDAANMVAASGGD